MSQDQGTADVSRVHDTNPWAAWMGAVWGAPPSGGPALDAWSYWLDACQRGVLFWDVMRQRGDNYVENIAKTAPNVLKFECTLVADGRKLPRPVNYALVRITPPAGVEIDPRKRPFVVVDPRAGHGPGIGGFQGGERNRRRASRRVIPCYFVGFLPEPVPGQTIEDIMNAEATFLERVIELHPEAEGKPAVIGNCQAGWAVMMLAAARPELFGPILIAGSPLSYWAGVHGKNPMRYTGGLLGGSWLTALHGRSRQRQVRRRLARHRTSRTSIPPTRSGRSNTISTPRSTARRHAISASRSGGAATCSSTPRKSSSSSMSCSSATSWPRRRS